MALNHLLPVAVSYKSNLLDIIWKAKEVYGDDYKKYIEYESSQVAEISKKVCNVYECCGRIDTECDRLMKIGSREQAVEFHDKVIPIMEKIRAELDTLEMIIDDQMWPMPKYRELLFIS